MNFTNSNKSVSVLTCTQFKRYSFIENLARILDKQTYENIIEWCIVNGTSDDSEHDKLNLLLKKIKCNKINIKIISDKNLNSKFIGSYRNLANKNTNGDIIVWMDDDDYYFPSYVETCVNSLNKYEDIMLVGCSGMLMYDYGFDTIFSLRPFGQNHTVNCCLAYKKEYIKDHFYQEERSTGEEKSFLDDYKNKMIQLPPNNAIIHMSYADNTYSEKRLNQMNNMAANIENNNIPKIYNETKHTLKELINDDAIYNSFIDNFKRINNQFETDVVFYYGNIENEWDPRSDNYRTIYRRSVELGKKLLTYGLSVSVYGKFPFNSIDYNGVLFYNLKYFNVRRKMKNLFFMDIIGFMPICQYEEIYNKINSKNIFLDLQNNFFQIKKYLRNYHNNLKIVFKNQFHPLMNPDNTLLELPNKNKIDHIIIPNGIDDKFKKDNEVERIKNRFCYTSNYTNGIEVILKFCWPKVIEQDPDAQFHIYYGMTDSRLEEDGKEMMKELFLQDGVYEHGRVPQNDIVEEFKKSSFLLYFTSSPQESDCMSVMESLASGCIPIIWNQNIFSNFNGLQVSQDPRQSESYKILANKMIDLIKEDPKNRTDIINQFKNSESIITWDNCISILLSNLVEIDVKKAVEFNKNFNLKVNKKIDENFISKKEYSYRIREFNLPHSILLNTYCY